MDEQADTLNGIIHFCKICGDWKLIDDSGTCSQCTQVTARTIAISQVSGESDALPNTFDTAEELRTFLDKIILDKNKK